LTKHLRDPREQLVTCGHFCEILLSSLSPAALSGSRWFSTLDLASGYWQVAMDASTQEKAAFVTPSGLYEWNVMPFGLCNALSTLERLMELVLRVFIGQSA